MIGAFSGHMADEKAAGNIVASIKEQLPYELIEFSDRFGRCTLDRTDFYGIKRLFFHYLDVALRDVR